MNSKAVKKQEKKVPQAPKQDNPKQPQESRPVVSAQERCRAVLSIWTERRTPTQVCREYGIAWAVLNNWQRMALEGMVTGLEPKHRKESRQHSAELPSRLQSLLEKHREKTSKVVAPQMQKSQQNAGDTAS